MLQENLLSARKGAESLIGQILSWSDVTPDKEARSLQFRLQPRNRLLRDVKSSFAPSAPGELPTQGAADCLCDIPRTHRFVRAVRNAVTILEKRFPEGELLCADVGCGPYALLSVAAATASRRVKVRAIESNPNSAVLAQEVIKRLGLTSQISIEQADALKCPIVKPNHLFCSETFDPGNTEEFGTKICERFKSSVIKGGLIIPDAVRVYAGLQHCTSDSRVHYSSDRTSWIRVSDNCFSRDVSSLTSERLQASLPRIKAGKYELFVSTGLYFDDALHVPPLVVFTVPNRSSLITYPSWLSRIFIDKPDALAEILHKQLKHMGVESNLL